MDADKKKALDMAMHQIEKDFGKGSIMMLGEASAKMNIEVIPTGALSLDIALVSAVFRADALLRFTVPNLPVKLPLLCI